MSWRPHKTKVGQVIVPNTARLSARVAWNKIFEPARGGLIDPLHPNFGAIRGVRFSRRIQKRQSRHPLRCLAYNFQRAIPAHG